MPYRRIVAVYLLIKLSDSIQHSPEAYYTESFQIITLWLMLYVVLFELTQSRARGLYCFVNQLICVSCADEPCLELRGRKVDALPKHQVEESAEEVAVAF